MRTAILVLALFPSLLARPASSGEPQQTLSVVVSPQAETPIRLAAEDLVAGLSTIFPKTKIDLRGSTPDEGRVLYVGLASQPEIKPILGRLKTSRPGGYVLVADEYQGREVAAVAGHDPLGAAYGVYALLEALGCGFYLSYDAFPAPQDEIVLDFEAINDAPLVSDRLVFNWHNFLSGCSTWNIEHWNHWTDQSLKMGYNAIMVHAYGNNPMFAFEFAGQQKPVGFLSTTVKGRDWSTQHVNDVRRLFGGFVFNEPVFGPSAGLAPDEQRVAAARKLMYDAFAHAKRRGMGVFFAVDVDTTSANPQPLIKALPESARFAINVKPLAWMGQEAGAMWLANPDTPEGYRYYKAQVDAVLRDYPQVSTLVVWFRAGGTPWMELKLEELPAAWQEQFNAEAAKDPAVAKFWKGPGLLAVSRVVAAYQRAIAEAGRSDVRLATGSWNFHFLPAADRFMPKTVAFIPLDYDVLHEKSHLSTPEQRAAIRTVAQGRPVIPVVWAHHDDGHYIGRPYTPYPQFHSKLVDARAAGFGIIHWTTRPLDLYFKSLGKQVWQNTKDQPLHQTCRLMAQQSFGEEAQRVMGDYLMRWSAMAPRFGRETSDRFIDRQLTDVEQVIAASQQRLALLKRARVADESRNGPQQQRLAYCRGMEEFVQAFFRTQDAYQQAEAAMKKGDLAAARSAMAKAQPEKVIDLYAKTVADAGITRGEQGLIVSMNLRWLTHHERLRQSLAMAPVRYCFGPTSHDPLAQSAGKFTFHVDAEKGLWQRFGERETGAEPYTLPESTTLARDATTPAVYEEICRSGVEFDKPLSLTLGPIMDRDGRRGKQGLPLPAGAYRVELLFADPTSTATGQRVMKIDVGLGAGGVLETYRFEPAEARFVRLACRGNSANAWNSICEMRLPQAGPLAADAVRASGALPSYEAAKAVDGKLDTRWAIEGDDHWIEVDLGSPRTLDHIDIAWYAASTREPKFKVLVSADRARWKETQPRAAETRSVREETIDLFQSAGDARRVVVKRFDVSLDRPGPIVLTLAPVAGKGLLSGVVLRPVGRD